MDIVVNISFSNNTNIYENNAVRISFFPALIFSSSPKLNFFIKAPVATDIPAAGVASARSHDWILSNALWSLATKVGYAAFAMLYLENNIVKLITNINSIFIIFLMINHTLSKNTESYLIFLDLLFGCHLIKMLMLEKSLALV